MSTLSEDKEAIRDLLSSYCFHTDRGNPDALAALFTEDCIWEGGKFGRREGRRAVHEFAVKGAARETKFRHLTMNSIITVAGDKATARSYGYVLKLEGTAAPAPFFAGFYEDELVKVGGKWLFKVRNIQAT
jgi:hypothetical protein